MPSMWRAQVAKISLGSTGTGTHDQLMRKMSYKQVEENKLPYDETLRPVTWRQWTYLCLDVNKKHKWLILREPKATAQTCIIFSVSLDWDSSQVFVAETQVANCRAGGIKLPVNKVAYTLCLTQHLCSPTEITHKYLSINTSTNAWEYSENGTYCSMTGLYYWTVTPCYVVHSTMKEH